MSRFTTGSLVLLLMTGAAHAQQVAPLWKDYVQAKKSGATPLLPDFSYAGYHFSELPLPDNEGKKKFSVTDYGAIPNDDGYDDDAIQKAINAAESNPGGGVVFFPPGRYLVAPEENKGQPIRISKSNIVLKGSGSGEGGTEIYQHSMRINTRLFLFKPDNADQERVAVIVSDASRESFWVQVQDAALLRPGQDVVIRHRSEAYTRWYFGPLPLKPQWTRLFGKKGGMQVAEIHTIEKIEGNRVKFRNPLHLDVHIVPDAPFELCTYTALEECGIEDILFSSNWKNYPEDFIHHKNAIHDGGWVAVGMEYVKNSWIRRCSFHDWNEGVFMRAGYQVTLQGVTFRGKKGHSSIHARTGYGVLVTQCHFNGAQHHGPGTGYSAAGTVITECDMETDQQFDSHSGQPYATLFDDVEGGVFYNLGGPEPGHPHHGRQLVLWNFVHRSATERHYNFWDMERRRNYTIAQPILVGFQSAGKVTVENAGLNQLPEVKVLPRSLFRAQLALRLKGEDITAGGK